jgi:hypothetical protein
VRTLLLGPWGMHVVAPVLKFFVTETQSRIEYGSELIRLLTFHDLSPDTYLLPGTVWAVGGKGPN